jgi:hypothetical protein
MSNNPSIHQQYEKRFIANVERLLKDERLRLDTSRGRRAVVSLQRDVQIEDREVELKRLMIDLDMTDRALQSRMPAGRRMIVTLSRNFLFFFRRAIGKLRIVSISPWQDLLQGKKPQAITWEVQRSGAKTRRPRRFLSRR